ncbi:hypothetical protein [Enterobacter hormaechei]|uniref:hypothetical protein n=1 Tax=Enterobacter hormaechei TaxID=158836 RepID=UPI0013D10724|nr:hypothetical protein [Enterobacter hormaechei]
MTNVSAVEKMAELMQQMEENSPRVATLQYCLAQLEARCAALAAENAGLKESRKNLAQFIHEELDAGYPLNMNIETPATDAFLAEVRAQGVEMFAAHKRERQQALRSRSMRMSEEAAGMAADAENFADELRKGVQS